jgi:hypothetical protein
MKNKETLLLIGGAVLLLYLLRKAPRLGSLERGVYSRQDIDKRPGCHYGEIANYVRRAV